MKLSEVVSSIHLTAFEEVPLLVLLGIFVGVGLHLLTEERRFQPAAALSLKRVERRRSSNAR